MHRRLRAGSPRVTAPRRPCAGPTRGRMRVGARRRQRRVLGKLARWPLRHRERLHFGQYKNLKILVRMYCSRF